MNSTVESFHDALQVALSYISGRRFLKMWRALTESMASDSGDMVVVVEVEKRPSARLKWTAWP